MCLFQTKNVTLMCPFNFLGLSKINLIYALLWRLHAFGGHFWPKFVMGGPHHGALVADFKDKVIRQNCSFN